MSEQETRDRGQMDADESGEVEAVEPDQQEGNGGEEGEVASPEDELEAARAEAAANYDRYLRSVAELDNYRKRTVRMRTEAREDTLRDLLLQVAPVLDNLHRALGQQTQDADSLKQGVELICGQFNEVLKGYGLAEIEAVGQSFDPNLHEALAEVPSAEHEPGTVMEEMEKGYKLNDKVVRPSRVVVSKAIEEK
ncbi:MAG TPA: nucleotide exchange factor GrpE [Candidatus Latescibacteria bacterium]|nr:nucleotide exchange factor GrpE [Candidatus Handelsmanbacteria bacterium]HIL07741.1 nucleotide exchange factor GrpE [Candidatus Latescibacterota bacterium]